MEAGLNLHSRSTCWRPVEYILQSQRTVVYADTAMEFSTRGSKSSQFLAVYYIKE